MAPSPPGFEQLLQSGAGVGLFSGILPFIITYALFFFLIKQIDLLDEGNNETFAAILAIAFAFYTSRFIIQNPAYQGFILNYVGRITLITVGVLGLMVVLAFIGMDLSDQSGLKWILGLVVLVAFTVSGGIPVIAGQGALGQVAGFFYWLIDSGVIWVLAVLALLGWTLSNDDEEGGGAADLADAIIGGE